MISFVAKGYVEVFRDGTPLSKHTQERKAIEAILADAEGRASAVYEIHSPVIRATLGHPGGSFDINGAMSLP